MTTTKENLNLTFVIVVVVVAANVIVPSVAPKQLSAIKINFN